ncbi:hypothetical protein GQ44DRAFT_632271 [Phaeosphaeriaceae sp. PMI808]|nr:hypothetical protein GQ44DRAFT_632271 [Phaeosphaeriaceae sp. PMI808]
MRSNIPTIDFGRFRTGSATDREKVASEFDAALSSVGFFHLQNHGISFEDIEAYFEKSKQFFGLPEHYKSKLCPAPNSLEQGYFGVEKEMIRGKKCLKENFDFSDPENDPAGAWPEEEQLPGFRHLAIKFHLNCFELTRQLLECASLALKLGPTESFGQYHGGVLDVSSFIHYPEALPHRLRSGEAVRNPAHSDLSTLTLLFQHGVGGLQVADMSSTDKTSSAAVDASAKFIDIEPRTDSILVNAGYLLMRWTNGRWKNTVHRVSEPPTFASNDQTGPVPERYSIAFFSFPDAETLIEPLHVCCSEEKPKRWQPLNAGEYIRRKRGVLYPS